MTFLAIALGLIPGFAWLVFYLREDCHPEPKRLILLTFVHGSAFAFFALGAQVIIDRLMEGLGVYAGFFLGVVIFAIVEELFKFAAAYTAVHKNKDFDEPVDTMIYTIVAALGFATVENLGALGSVSLGPAASLTGVTSVLLIRFAGATLLHTITSGIMGYFWEKSIKKFGSYRYLIIGFVIATVFHIIFNFLILCSPFGHSCSPIGLEVPLLLILGGFFVLHGFGKLRNRVL